MSDEKLETNPFAALEDKPDPKVPTATLQIYKFIDEYLKRGSDTHVNRASAATMCFKRRWYQKNGAPAEPLTPRKMVNFLLGNLSEHVMQYFISQACVGEGRLYSEVDFGKETGQVFFQGKPITIYEQEDLVAEIGGIQVTAHVDGWGKRNSDGKWELIECKSAANYGFDDFKDTGPKDYLKQANVCMQTNRAIELGVREVRYFYLKKETGHLWDRLFTFDSSLAEDVASEYQLANADEEPKAPHVLVAEMSGAGKNRKPTGRRVAGFPCTYCPYLEQCQGKYDVEWKAGSFGANKPVYVFNQEEEKV